MRRHRRRFEAQQRQQRRRGAALTRVGRVTSAATNEVATNRGLDANRRDVRDVNRRDALLSLASLAAPSIVGPLACPSEASAASEGGVVPLAAALRAQTVYAGFCIPIIEKHVTAPLEDAIALAIRDAGTFDASTGRGGLDGSVRFELDRPENARFRTVVGQLAEAKKEIDARATEPVGWADLIALAPFGKARYAFLRDFCGVTPRFEPRWQYKAGDITLVGCDYEGMLTPPFGRTPEQIEATSWFRQNYASTGPLTGSRVHMVGTGRR